MTIGTGWCTGPVPTNTNCTFLMCSPKTRVSTSVKSPPSLSAHFTSIFELQKGVSQQCIICTLLYYIPSYFKENDSKIQTLETLNNSDGSGLRFFGLGRARAFPCRARARVGLRPDYEGFFGRARALHFRARVGLGPG